MEKYQENLAVDDRDTPITHVILRWCDGVEQWDLVSLARDKDEASYCANYWTGKGVKNIKVIPVCDI